jgi:GT2 family glycosyltransferase
MTGRPRVLHCITAYNGWEIVPRAVRSAARLDRDEADIDVLVLDDCSPSPGFSSMIAGVCREEGVGYYRTPRNLGIVRNNNLGLLAGLDRGYDYVVIANSDVIFPRNLVDQLVRVHQGDPSIGSVTAWSNNVSAYSIPNADPDAFLGNQDVVDWLSASLAGFSGTVGMDIPAGISFSMLFPMDVVRDVGLFDPVFGRGYCEETDWSLRSVRHGYRLTLALGTFVYHAGRGSNVEAGLVTGDQTTVPENEAIIDLRYPLFRWQLRAFWASGLLGQAQHAAIGRIVSDAGRQFGYSIEVGWLPRVSADDSSVRVQVSPDGQPVVRASFLGFSHDLPVDEGTELLSAVRRFFGTDPKAVYVQDRGAHAAALAQALGGLVHERRTAYPSRV